MMKLKRQLIPILLGIVVGAAIAVVLTRDRASEVRQDVANTAVEIGRRLQQNSGWTPLELDVVLAEARKTSPRAIAWMQLRRADNRLIAQTGIEERAAFTLQYVKARHANRKGAVKVVERDGKRVLVEAFPVRIGGATGALRVLRVAHRAKVPGSVPNALLEIAVFLDDQSR
ncbi:MAG: hypothetical protein JNK48_26925 [Bryobacterales bacterium]|nr:hypothetical protein [Bryobacterales bacterium]